MLDTIDRIEKRFQEVEASLMDPAAVSDMKRYAKLRKEHNNLKNIMEVAAVYRRAAANLKENREIVQAGADRELVEMAKAEIPELEQRISKLTEELQTLMLPRDENDAKSAIMEIRAGTGGEEAALFAGDLFRMYSHYAEKRKWSVEVMNSNPSDKGGFKEIVFAVEGADVYGDLKFENGVHRVQRVPETEAQGRVHTSASSVVVMPEADDVEVAINPADIRIDVFRSSGPGGQNVNKTESAVRITHIPTGVVVSCQDEKSQHKNKAKALKVLKTRILDMQHAEQEKSQSDARRRIIGTGDRSEKIRTYNFPQNRLTDHRVGLTLYRLERIMDGDLQEIVDTLRREEVAEKMKIQDASQPGD